MTKVILDEQALEEIGRLLRSFPIEELPKVEKVIKVINSHLQEEEPQELPVESI